MALTLNLIQQPEVPLEVEGIVPDRVREMSATEIEVLEVFHGNRPGKLRDFFRVEGDPSDGVLIWEGDMSRVHWIGAKMSDGTIRVAGNAGRHLGSEMSGGEIHVDGDAGDWVGGELHGGLINVHGDAGHLIGAAYRGSMRGMSGGTILVHGSGGNEIGHTMRRGLIAVGGGCGDLAGFNMLAGTIVVFGTVGIRHGAGMKRGTIALLGDDRPDLLLSYFRACRCRPDILQIVSAN